MNQNENQLLFDLLRSAICGSQLTEQERMLYSDEILPNLMVISKKHDIAHLVTKGLYTNGLLIVKNQEISNEIAKAIYRYTQLNYEYGRICEKLEMANIPFLPLKGSVLRQYYPEPWMRTSCDIDILVHENDLERATNHIANCLGYTYDGKGAHDVSLFLDKKIHLELHYALIGDGVANSSCEVLKRVWQYAFPHKEKKCWYDMTDDMFYFYHIAHMAKHFEDGGCGIRPFIDLWILDKMETADNNERNELLERGDLLKFAEVARQLSKVWFEGANHTDITKQMEQYILRGGVYGTSENRIAVQQQKKGGRLKYALSKIFISYDTIKFHYPILQKHRWLTPIMEVRRWFKLVFCGHAKRSMRELKQNNNISAAEAENIQAFLNNIGL